MEKGVKWSYERGSGQKFKRALSADYTIFIPESREDLQYIMNDFGKEYNGMRLNINTYKSKVLVIMKDQRERERERVQRLWE